jgi:hypothetical protein
VYLHVLCTSEVTLVSGFLWNQAHCLVIARVTENKVHTLLCLSRHGAAGRANLILKSSLCLPHRVLRCCISSSSAISSSNWHVSCGFAIHAVVQAKRALKSLAPALRNWSPTCSVFPPSMPPKMRWQAKTPQDLSPMSTKTSLPPGWYVS